MVNKPQEKLGLGIKLSYGTGDFYGGASVTVIATLFLFFLTDIVLINPIYAKQNYVKDAEYN